MASSPNIGHGKLFFVPSCFFELLVTPSCCYDLVPVLGIITKVTFTQSRTASVCRA